MLVIRIEVNFRLEFKYAPIYSRSFSTEHQNQRTHKRCRGGPTPNNNKKHKRKRRSFQKLDVNDTIKRLSRSYIDKSKRKLFFIFSICRRQGKSVSAICISSSLTDNLVECVQFGAKVLPKSSRHILFRCLFIFKKNKSDETRQNRV